jgi:hypothetical protein
LNDLALMAPQDLAPPLARTQVCSRCGSFAQELLTFGEQRLCVDCSNRFVEQQRQVKLYPAGYLWAVGLLGNGAISSLLAALNWKRLGQPERARTAWMLTALCLGVSVVTIAVPALPRVMIFVVSLAATRQVVEGLGPLYDEHRARGGRRASLMLPMLAVVALFIGAVLVVTAVTVVGG